MQGFDLDGGHDETIGVSPSGDLISVPLHRHQVSMDLVIVELQGQYTFRPGWTASARVPFSRKDQWTDVVLVEDATPAQVEAMRANGRLHHRTELYSGIQDPQLLLGHQRAGLFRDDDVLSVSVGTSLPLGKTEANPYSAGAEGREHLHIQFGSGTFDPLLEAAYRLGLGAELSASAFFQSRLTFYENDKGMEAPTEFLGGFSLGRAFGRLDTKLHWTLYRQGRAYWDGEVDPNSGVRVQYVGGGASWPVSPALRLETDLRWPVQQSLLDDSSEAFEQGLTLQAGIRWSGR